MHGLVRRTLARWGASLLLITAFGFAPARADGEGPRILLRIGLDQLGLGDASRGQVQAAFSVWAEELTRNLGEAVAATTTVYSSTAELREAVRAGVVDLAILHGLTFLELRDEGLLEPFMTVGDLAGEAGERFVLLVPAAAGASAVRQLAGARVLVHAGNRGPIPRRWLQTLLGGAGAPLDGLREVPQPSGAVLPVFFGQAAAGVVTVESFETLVELNPQLGARLRVLERSPPFCSGVTCFRVGFKEDKLQRTIRENVERLHTYPAGRQLMTLFRVGRTVPYRPDSLLSLERLAAPARSTTSSAGRLTGAASR